MFYPTRTSSIRKQDPCPELPSRLSAVWSRHVNEHLALRSCTSSQWMNLSHSSALILPHSGPLVKVTSSTFVCQDSNLSSRLKSTTCFDVMYSSFFPQGGTSHASPGLHQHFGFFLRYSICHVDGIALKRHHSPSLGSAHV